MATVRELVTKWGFVVDDRPLQRMDARIAKVKQSTVGLRNLALSVGAGFAAIGAGIGLLLREAGNFEQVEIAFEVLTKSKDKAKKLISDLTNFAQKTPFELKGVFDGTKKLLAYGIQAKNMIKTLTALGNIASAVGREKLPQLTLAFGQVKTADRLKGTEVRQFTEAGVPILEAVAAQMKVAVKEVPDLISKGAVSFEIVDAALQNLANGSGRFAGLMERQSASLLGIFSNLKDSIQVLAITIGGTLVPEAKAYLNQTVDWIQANKVLIKQNSARFIQLLVRGMKQLVKVGKGVYRITKAIINSFGGFENVIKGATAALSLFVGVRVVGFLGDIGLLALSAGKNLVFFALKSRTAAVALFTLKAAALAIPLAIGAAVAAMFLIIEDMVVFFQGGDSLIGRLVNNFDEGMPQFLRAIDKFEKQALGFVKRIVKKINKFLTDEEFAADRQKIADALLAALQIALVGSKAFFDIGFQIGQIITDGMIQAIMEASPRLSKFLGLQTQRQRSGEFKKAERLQRVENAKRVIAKHGLKDAQKVFSPEIIQEAQQKDKRLRVDNRVSRENLKNIRNNPEGLKVLFNNPALAEALRDGVVTTAEMINDSSIVDSLAKLQSTFPPTSNTFETKVEIHGSNLNEQELESAVEKGINKAQLKTVRDLQSQGKSAIIN